MSKKRIKVALPTITTRDEAEAVMNELALAANNRRKLNTQLDAAILKLKENIAPALAECDDAIKTKTDILLAWAQANPEQFGKKKSIEMLAGTLGFRTGTPKLVLLSRAFTWEKVLENVQRLIPAFVRGKPEIDKEAILAQRDEETLQHALKACGMKVVQDEGFFVEPKLTDTPNA
jgi:phage host-nuclease inhibitor protein Gam